MKDFKRWYQSGTVVSVILALLSFVAGKFIGVHPEDIKVPANASVDQLKVIADQVQIAKDNPAETISTIAGSILSILAIYKRIVAKKVIAVGEPPKVVPGAE